MKTTLLFNFTDTTNILFSTTIEKCTWWNFQ